MTIRDWLHSEPSVVSAVLFGSCARTIDHAASADSWSDVDLHLITTAPRRLESVDWGKLFPTLHFCHKVLRPASGGVRKLTVLFAEGELDLILVPSHYMRLARLVVWLRLQGRVPRLTDSFNIFATIISGGYLFLKGEEHWGWFYAAVSKFPGVRIDNVAAQELADGFLCDLLWYFQKIQRGELIAAQRMLHRMLVETNICLMHELRMRERKPTFQQARRVEILLSPTELRAISVHAGLDAHELQDAGWKTFIGLTDIMSALVPSWCPSGGMRQLLAPYESLGQKIESSLA